MVKIRQGFVSNSSSSSFCIYGAYFEDDELVDFYKKIINKKPNEEELEEVCELAEEIADKLELEYHCGPFGDGHYLGRSWDRIKDEETGKQFKENVEKKIKKQCHSYEEAWRDG